MEMELMLKESVTVCNKSQSELLGVMERVRQR